MDPDLEETVRIILMTNPETPMKAAREIVRDIHPRANLTEFSEMWIAFKGSDRVAPWKKVFE